MHRRTVSGYNHCELCGGGDGDSRNERREYRYEARLNMPEMLRGRHIRLFSHGRYPKWMFRMHASDL